MKEILHSTEFHAKYCYVYFGTWVEGRSEYSNLFFAPSQIRQRIGDFGVLLAILIMVGIDIAVGINTPNLIVPDQFKVGLVP